MRRTTIISMAVLLTAFAVAAPMAHAQHGVLALGDLGALTNPAGTRTPAQVAADGFTASGVEPKELAGMLVRQNETRQRVGAPSLVWSSELADQARASVMAETGTTCGISAVRRMTVRENMTLHWVPPLRRIDGAVVPQAISAPYVVSEWNAGASEFDTATRTCRGSGPCVSYARMIAPEARLVGCAKVTCASGAQIFACSYAPAEGGDKKPAKARTAKPKG